LNINGCDELSEEAWDQINGANLPPLSHFTSLNGEPSVSDNPLAGISE
jgi:hypothetical protein